MLVAAAVCPHPPLLVPELAAGAAAELDPLRAACDEAVRRLLAADADTVVVVGGGATAGRIDPAAAGSLAGFGVELRVGHASGPTALPLALTIGRWLLDRARYAGPWAPYAVTPDGWPAVADEIGALPGRLALLVMGDGSARRTEKAPGYVDARAAAFDASTASALATGPGAVAELDGTLAAELLAAGWPAWQVLARLAAGGAWTAELLAEEAPYGVGYFVATWLPRPDRG